MHVRISDQLALFAASFICGCLLSVFYDIIRMTRMSAGVEYSALRIPARAGLHLPLLPEKKEKTRSPLRDRSLNVLVFFGDVLFFAVAAFCLLCVFFNYGGKVRGSAVLLAAAGFACCHFTVGAAIIYLFGFLKIGLGILCEYVIFLIMLPVRKLIVPAWKYTAGYILRAVRYAYLRIYTKRTEKRLLDGLCGLKTEAREVK